MTKYIISIASELDGHAGSSAYYIQVENRLTRQDKIRLIGTIIGSSSKFVENEYIMENEGDMTFHGNIIDTFDYDGETFSSYTPVSISMAKLPSRITKNKLFGVESRTG